MEPNAILKKLRIDAAKKNLIVNAPESYRAVLAGISCHTTPDPAGNYDFVQVFATSQAELERLCTEVAGAGKFDCLFWACYPKGTSSVKSDIKRDTVWKAFDLIGLQAVTQVAIDDTWSALRGRPPQAVGK